MKTTTIITLLTLTLLQAGELEKEIKYLGNDGTETKNQIICANGNKAFVYSNNTTREIRVKVNNLSKNLGKVTLNEVVERVCQ